MNDHAVASRTSSIRRLTARSKRVPWSFAWVLIAAVIPVSSEAQAPGTPVQGSPTTATPAAPASTAAPTGTAAPNDRTSPLEPFAWLHGCWDGKVNQRDFREEWLPLRGDMMIGVSQTDSLGKTLDYTYLRLESRPEGVFYVALPSGKKETSFRYSGKTVDDGREIFTFENPVDEFPQRILYRRGTEGWLYAHVEGKIGEQPRSVIYPMRRVDCATGTFIRQ